MAKNNDRIAKFIIASTDTVKELLIVYFVIIALATAAFVHFEGMKAMDALWMTFVTATTTGYGDMFAKTIGGRIVAVILMHLTTFFVIPLVTARLAGRLIVDNDTFTHDEQEDMKNTLKEMRQYLIERAEEKAANESQA